MHRRARALLLLGSLNCAIAKNECDEIRHLAIPHGRITSSELVPAGTLTRIGETAVPGPLPSFCRVAMTLTPSVDSEIRAEVWLPESGWNGRFQGTGNGGYAGNISLGALAGALHENYAVANTDMGMSVTSGSDAGVFTGRPERWKDWGYRATHEMTVAGKRITAAYYGRKPHHSYFVGCSTGGQQALMEAQRFPSDYDGIVAGAPAHNRTGVHTSVLWTFAATQRTAASSIPPEKARLLTAAATAACDAQDGLRDGLISDPRHCAFEPETLICKGPDAVDCLTREQVDTARRIYGGAVNPRTGERIYGGLLPGSEDQWPRLQGRLGALEVPPFNPLFKWVFGAAWDWHTFDFDHNYAQLNAKLARDLNATNPDLDRFRSLGHKLILWHGWADWLVPPEETIKYYEAVQGRLLRRSSRQTTEQFARLYMLPGTYHCSSGPGPNRFDQLGAVVKWVEEGVAPRALTASKYQNDNVSNPVELQRLICPWPEAARYDWKGDPRQLSSFQCAPPNGQSGRVRD